MLLHFCGTFLAQLSQLPFFQRVMMKSAIDRTLIDRPLYTGKPLLMNASQLRMMNTIFVRFNKEHLRIVNEYMYSEMVEKT